MLLIWIQRRSEAVLSAHTQLPAAMHVALYQVRWKARKAGLDLVQTSAISRKGLLSIQTTSWWTATRLCQEVVTAAERFMSQTMLRAMGQSAAAVVLTHLCQKQTKPIILRT